MFSAINDTVVVCRPQQVREAAIVLSCCPADRFTPLIVIEPPPISEADYRTLYDAYVVARDRRDAMVGGSLARREALADPAAVLAANVEVDLKAEALTPYRSWWGHQRQIGDLMRGITIRRAVFLFVPPLDEVQLINAVPMSRIGEERKPIFPESVESVHLLPQSSPSDAPSAGRHVYRSLAELTDVAWRACGRADGPPPEAVNVSGADPASFFPGLWRALKLGVPLRAGVAADATPVGADAEDECAAGEAVLIEVSADATRLLGVQYAFYRQARLVMYPEPDASGVEHARRAVEDRQDALRRQAPAELMRWSPAALREHIFADPAISDRIRLLEQAVSDLVPDSVVADIGDLDLTVFTTGVPYNFVRKSGADWSNKAIGHIAGDASLLILGEFCRKQTGTDVTFSVIFDPGYFKTSETSDVFAVLEKRLSYPLVLRGAAGSGLALLHVGPSLPLDLLFFNTHGSDNAILLSDGPLPAFKLLQRQTLPSRPFVFNSSCLSWVGVGREFVRIGARGYAGTLWSVDADAAASYAGIVLERVTRNGWPVSRAMRNTGVERATERAYIYIGSCAARLEDATSTFPDAERRRVLSAANMLLESAARSLGRTGGHRALPFITELEDLLWREAERLLVEYDRLWPEPQLDRVDVAIPHLQVLSAMARRWRADVKARVHVLDSAETMLNALTIGPKMRDERLAKLTRFGGRLLCNLGEVGPAIQLLARSAQAAERAGSTLMKAEVDLESCDVLRMLGRNEQALALATSADAIFAAEVTAQRGRLGSLGRLAQLSNALRRYDAALRYAHQGFDLATVFDDLKERAEFKGDEARVLLKLARYDEALAAAKTFLDLARRAHDEARELSAYGVITQALIGTRDLAQGQSYAQKGLDSARAGGFAASAGDFLMDFATIKSLGNDHAGALACALDAAPILAGTGHMPKTRVALGRAEEEYVALDPDGFRDLDALFRLLATQVAVVNLVDRDLRRNITTSIVHRMKLAITRSASPEINARLQALLNTSETLAAAAPAKTSEQLRFIVRALRMFDLAVAGRAGEARTIADQLDQLSDGGFELVGFVEKYVAPR